MTRITRRTALAAALTIPAMAEALPRTPRTMRLFMPCERPDFGRAGTSGESAVSYGSKDPFPVILTPPGPKVWHTNYLPWYRLASRLRIQELAAVVLNAKLAL